MNKELVFRKAERQQVKLRISLSGPSGSGKTYSALKLARGLVDKWEEIVLIDTENHRGDLYSHLGDYNILTLEAPFTPERFIEAIHLCEENGVKVIIIDSSSHEWDGIGGCLDANDKLAQAKFKGNTWAAWSVTTERHQRFIESIIASPCHIITTMRSKTDTIQTEDKKIKKVGLKDIQREGFEYEMTVAFNIDRENHMALVSKDNTELFEHRDPFTITEEDGKLIREWNQGGTDPEETKKKEKAKERLALTEEFKEQLKELKMTKATWEKAVKSKWEDLSIEEERKWIKKNQFKIDTEKTKTEEGGEKI
ncbi:MAG: AAA family ATPase [Negativicutes bacterium]|nr:AAA family ATPase [Negativicutes bacterium]